MTKIPTLQRPEADRPLNVDIVRSVLGEQFPDLPLDTVSPLGSGWEYDAYLVDHAVVFRFPRHSEVAAGLGRAEAVLDFLGAAAEGRLEVPKVMHRGVPGPDFPYPFLGHHLIPGTPASKVLAPASVHLAADLGRALSVLHSLPAPPPDLEVGPQKWTCRTAFSGLVELVEQVPGVQDLAPQAWAWLARSPLVPDAYQGPPRILHDDLQPDHIIVLTDSGRLSGIIDWGLATGDPAQDLTFILPWWGWGFTEEVLRAYVPEIDPDFLSRLDFLGRVRALGALGHALSGAGEVSGARRMVENMFLDGGAS